MTLGYGPGPASPPAFVPPETGWAGVEPDGSPVGMSLLVVAGSTLTATTSLGRAYPPGALVSATIEDDLNFVPNYPQPGFVPPFRVTVPHAEWVDAATGQLLIRIAPGQCPPARPGYPYSLVVRAIVAGIVEQERRTSLVVQAPYVPPAEAS